MQAAFETIGFGKASTSAADARALGYLRDVDAITMNRERLIADAKTHALARVAEGYSPPVLDAAIPVGGADMFAMLSLGVHLAHRAGRLSDHDALIGRKLAWILSGGDLPHKAIVSETYLLDLEREAFLACAESGGRSNASRTHLRPARRCVTDMAALPIVLVPGIQGRWEWMTPTVEALREHRDVLTFSLQAREGMGHLFPRGAGAPAAFPLYQATSRRCGRGARRRDRPHAGTPRHRRWCVLWRHRVSALRWSASRSGCRPRSRRSAVAAVEARCPRRGTHRSVR